MLLRRGHEDDDSSGDEEPETLEIEDDNPAADAGPFGLNLNAEESENDSYDSDMESSSDEEEVKKVQEEDDDEDPVIRAIRAARETKVSDKPPDLKLDAIPSTISFHPTQDLILACDYDGSIEL